MPSSSRATTVDLSVTPYYHCISRCVRRAFLCGDDTYAGKNFDHRKEWFRERLRLASESFAIDVCAYAIMSNHFHVVLRVDADRAAEWTDEAILRRYAKFFPLVSREARTLPKGPRRERIETFRERLTSLSWFMRVVNEFVARRANKEDGCTGRFWEGRFRSQALLDEAALYTCMSYVDLNPVRAGVSTSLEASDFTSIKQRLSEAAARLRKSRTAVSDGARILLAPLSGEGRKGGRRTLELRFDDYVGLLEWTGRAVGAKPGGRIRGGPPAVLRTLGIESDAWLATMHSPGFANLTTFGSVTSMDAEARRRDKSWLKGCRRARRLFRAAS